MDTVDKIIAQWAKEKPELNTCPMGVMGRLARLTKYLEKEIAAVHETYGLKLGEFDVLVTLLRSGPPYQLTPSELMNSVMLTSGAMTNRLDKLEQKHFIVRTHSQIDRRSISVQLTNSGYTLINQALADHVKTQEKLSKSLSIEQQHELSDLLRIWLTAFNL
ncbi:MarR family transcriptional regulator [Vibrio sp. PP-XX7]